MSNLKYHNIMNEIETHGSVLAAKKLRKKKMCVHTSVLFTQPVK